MTILETERTILREMDADDAGFILNLLNQPTFIKYIGDRRVRSLEQAADYIETRFTKSYRDNGFGLYLVELKELSGIDNEGVESPLMDGTLADARVSARGDEIQNRNTLADSRVSTRGDEIPNRNTLADARVSARGDEIPNRNTLADARVSAVGDEIPNRNTLADARVSAVGDEIPNRNTLADARVSAWGDEIPNPKSEIPNRRIGISGFVKRDTLPDPDIGFAFLPEYCGLGYAYESAAALMKYGRDILSLRKVLAITTTDNQSSVRLLQKIGFKFERLIKLSEDEDELNLYSAK